MTARSAYRAMVLGIGGVLLLAPIALADTCCANTAVGLEPASAAPGDTVRVTEIRCLNADNTGPLPLELAGFWLSSGDRAAEVHPDTAPGPGLPADLPPTDRWLTFDSVRASADGTGIAVITVPRLGAGTYQLWWTCDNGGGPGSGIHYSTGPRLAIGTAPDTAALPTAARSLSLRLSATVLLLLALGAGVFVATLASRRAPRAHHE